MKEEFEIPHQHVSHEEVSKDSIQPSFDLLFILGVIGMIIAILFSGAVISGLIATSWDQRTVQIIGIVIFLISIFLIVLKDFFSVILPARKI